MKVLILVLSLFLIVSFARRDDPKYWKHPFNDNKATLSGNLGSGTEAWFDEQIVDHFNYQSTRTWKQRYFYIKDMFNPSVGPVFLFICGEFTCPGIPPDMQWVITLAQQLQGMVLVPEHRFYGESMPFGEDSMKLDNLKYLNSEQALSDLAYFVQRMKSTKLHGITDKTPFLTISGSYPGALAAWFRSKYPHLAIGALASSAVIQAIEDMKDFDEQIYISSSLSGDYCAQAINQSSYRVQSILGSADGAAFKANFTGGDKLSDDQFLFFWVDSIVKQIQYGLRTNLCDGLKDKSSDDQFQYLKTVAHENQVNQYGASYYLRNETVGENSNSRSWYYQSCSEFGFWQTFSDRHPLRPFRLNIDFYRKFCNDAYGNNLWPKVQRKNIEYGGLNINTTNLFMTNGVEDPWRWASLQTSKDGIVSRIADCKNCAHISDLYSPSSQDPPELKKIRNEQYLLVQQWVDEYWKNTNSKLN